MHADPAAEMSPALQPEQDVPPTLLDWPAAQSWHVLPEEGWYLPIVQSLQAEEPEAAYLPPLHV